MDDGSSIFGSLTAVAETAAEGGGMGYLVAAALLILGGAYFAGTEISLASVSRIRMMSYADDGNRRAAKVLYILDHFEKALSTLLIGNNIMHLACASVTTLFAQKTWGSGAVTAVTFVTTLVVFFLSEMIPKAFAKACNEKFAMYSAGILIFLMKVMTPVSFLFTKLSQLIEKPLGMGEEEREPTVTEDELKEIIESIDEESEIDTDTSDLVKNVMAFSQTNVAQIITPWADITTLQLGMSRERILAIHSEAQYSRYPVVTGSGNLVGILQIRKYLKACAASKGRIPVTTLTDRPLVVDVDMPIDDLLEKFSASKIHLAVVCDSDGKYIGIVTVEDILEELVGEIYDESDEGGVRE